MDSVGSPRLQLRKSGFLIPRTVGGSMRPVFWAGQHRVVVVPLDGEPKVGDVLMFCQVLPDGTEKNVVHRLVEIEGDGEQRLYITRGDNCLGCERVRRPEIIGRVAEVHRLSGYRPWHAIPARKFAVTDRSYRIYTRIWMAIWPLRRFCYRVRFCYRNASAPIGALVRIVCDQENALRRLDPFRAFASLGASTFYLPFFNEDQKEARIRTLERLAMEVPCYEMHCRPDADAAFTCRKGLEKNVGGCTIGASTPNEH